MRSFLFTHYAFGPVVDAMRDTRSSGRASRSGAHAEGVGGVHNAAFAVAHALHKLPHEDVSPCRQRAEGEPEGSCGFSFAVAGVEVDVAFGPGGGVELSIHIGRPLAVEETLVVESFVADRACSIWLYGLQKNVPLRLLYL